jgi:hypothetical protein
MLRGFNTTLSAIVICTANAFPAPAIAASLDAAPTRSYLKDATQLLQTAANNLHASELAAGHIVAEIRDQCPNELADAPTREQVPLETEVLGAIYAAFDRPDHQAQRTYVALLHRLRWSNSVVTRLVREETRNEAATLALAVPDVCADARAWANSQFRILPASTLVFDRKFETILHAQEPQATIHRLLKPLMDNADRCLLRRVNRLQGHLTEALAEVWFPKASEARHAIGLAPPPTRSQ